MACHPGPATADPESPDVAALYERHAPELYRYCLSLLRNPDEAADAAQQAWVRALEHARAEGAELDSFRSWLFVVARNECFDLHRRRKRFQELPERGLTDSRSVELAQEHHEDMHALLLDLGRLSERQRNAIVLRELRGLSYEEVARSLDTSPEGARSLASEARQVLVARRSGRDEDCASVRERIDRAGAPRHGHFVQAHLDGCNRCAGYKVHDRRRRLRTFCVAPVLLIQRLFHARPVLYVDHAAFGARWVAGLAVVALGAHGIVAVPGRSSPPTARRHSAPGLTRAASPRMSPIRESAPRRVAPLVVHTGPRAPRHRFGLAAPPRTPTNVGRPLQSPAVGGRVNGTAQAAPTPGANRPIVPPIRVELPLVARTIAAAQGLQAVVKTAAAIRVPGVSTSSPSSGAASVAQSVPATVVSAVTSAVAGTHGARPGS
jgi:RNA polymerase sigma factor (sigma-70 family)